MRKDASIHKSAAEKAARERSRRWARESAASIEAHNRFVEENGPFGAEWRSW
jgi:post-segregation antitoxin (ccd killing protein)